MDELRAPPENLYKVIGSVFDEFWNMDFPDNVVNAFLARIDKRNCADYGLPDFASESCSLPVIQVSLFPNSIFKYSSSTKLHFYFHCFFC